MSLLSSGIFWFIGGILFCFMLASFKAWTIERGIRMPPWKWALVITWILLAGFTVALIGTSLGEAEKPSYLFAGSSFAALSLISGLALWRVLGLRSGRD